MKKRLSIAMVAVALAIGAVGVPSASAAVEFGSACTAEDAAPEYTLTTLAGPGPLSLGAPSNGVITKVRVAFSPGGGFPFSTIPSQVKTIRPIGANVFLATGQASANFAVGVTTANVRLPVLAGDRLALKGEPFTFEGIPVEGLSLYCDEADTSTLGAFKGNLPVGGAGELTPVTDAAIPLVATLEADADNDGYGDESQDGCPQSAAIQTACPVVTIDALNLVGKGSVMVLVTTSSAAPVNVTGTVKLGKGETAKLKTGTKTVAPGKFTRFKLKFNAALKEKLNELEPSKKLTLKITASATNVAGQVSKDKLNAKLRGQG